MMLYKYVHPDRMDVLTGGMIRFTQPAALNDPFESFPVGDTFKQSLIERSLKDLEPQLKSASDFERWKAEAFAPILADQNYKYLLDETRIYKGMLSLSENRSEILMWSHYCDSHRGFNIGFDTNHPFFQEIYPGEKTVNLKVKYADKRPYSPRVDSFKDSELKSIFLLTKSTHWQYEKEWRMMYNLRRLDNPINPKSQFPIYLVKYPVECVKEVILGCQMSKEKKKEIAIIVADKYPSAKVYEARISATEFDLNIIEFRNS